MKKLWYLKFSLLVLIAMLALTACDGSKSKSSSVRQSGVEDAYRVCTAMQGTGLVTQCDVSGWRQTIDVRIDTSSGEARKICAGVVSQLASKTRRLSSGWKLQIFSPYSGDRPIAICGFR